MSDEVQKTIPNANLASNEKGPPEVVRVELVNVGQNVSPVTRPPDDSVFAVTSLNSLTNTPASTGYHLANHASASRANPLGKNGSTSVELRPNGPERQSVPVSSQMKTFLVMKSINLSHPQIAPSSVNTLQTISTSNLLSPPATTSNRPHQPTQSRTVLPTSQKRRLPLQNLNELTVRPTLVSSTNPEPSPCYSATEPMTPATPLEKNPFSDGDQIPVVCKKNRAILDRTKLGSGQRGKCILFQNEWMSPSQFENACGLCGSKDWKRSIRHGGTSLHKLISDGFLQPHSAMCACAICSGDSSVNCPVRLYLPYKRRRRSAVTPQSPLASPYLNHSRVAAFPSQSPSLLVSHSDGNNFASSIMSQKVIEINEEKGTLEANLSPETEALIKSIISENDLAEQRLWWRLEESAKGLLEQARSLNVAVLEAKSVCAKRRLQMMQQLAVALTDPCNEEQAEQVEEQSRPSAPLYHVTLVSTQACSSVTDTSQTSTAKGSAQLVSAPSAVQRLTSPPPDVAVSHNCATCGAPAVSECTGCHKATYCSPACQEKDWLNGHSAVCQVKRNHPTVTSSTSSLRVAATSNPGDVTILASSNGEINFVPVSS